NVSLAPSAVLRQASGDRRASWTGTASREGSVSSKPTGVPADAGATRGLTRRPTRAASARNRRDSRGARKAWAFSRRVGRSPAGTTAEPALGYGPREGHRSV